MSALCVHVCAWPHTQSHVCAWPHPGGGGGGGGGLIGMLPYVPTQNVKNDVCIFTLPCTCSPHAGNGSCLNCIGTSRPSAEEFTKYLRWFLLENPGLQCATGGHAAFNASVRFGPDGKTVVGKKKMGWVWLVRRWGGCGW